MDNGKHITLTVTETCNLNCVYCYEPFKNARRMSFQTAVDIINRELNTEEQLDYIEIAFHGGEPLLEFDLIRRICEYVWEHNYNQKYYFFATTNGTLLNHTMKEWFARNASRFYLGLSLDGTEEVHNHNRSNSYDKIDFDFFLHNWPNQHVKMTISDYTIPRLSESIIHVENLGFRILANFAFGIDWTKINLDVLDRELFALVQYYSANPKLEICSLLNQDFQNIGLNFKRWCGAGVTMRVYDVTGKLFPCHFFQEFAIGKEKSVLAEKIDFSDDGSFIDEKCKNCLLVPLCPTCYGYNYATTGDISKRDDGMCVLTKHCILAASYLAYQRLQHYSDTDLGIDEEKRRGVLRGVYRVQQYFKNES